MTLLRIYRKHPDVIPAAEWALRIVSLMDDVDLVSVWPINCLSHALHKRKGVVICVTSLVMAMAQDHLDAFAVCYTKAVDRLNKVGSRRFLRRGVESNE